jgi:hypothetical protein
MQLKNEEALAAVGRSGEGGYKACTHNTTSRKQKRNQQSEAAKLARDKFVWRGLSLHLGRSSKPLLTVVPDVAYPHLFRIKHSDGWTSVPANLTRARDAAYGHARYLLGAETPAEASYSPEDEVEAGREAA